MADYNQKNIQNKDTFVLFVSKNIQKEVTTYYQFFGWKVLKNTSKEKSKKVSKLTFYRSNKIKNKYDLQFYQVQMEEILKNISKLNKQRVCVIVFFNVLFYSLTSVFWGLGLYLIIKNIGFYFNFTGGILFVLGAIVLGLKLLFFSKTITLKEQNYKLKQQCLNSELQTILNVAKELTRGKNE